MSRSRTQANCNNLAPSPARGAGKTSGKCLVASIPVARMVVRLPLQGFHLFHLKKPRPAGGRRWRHGTSPVLSSCVAWRRRPNASSIHVHLCPRRPISPDPLQILAGLPRVIPTIASGSARMRQTSPPRVKPLQLCGPRLLVDDAIARRTSAGIETCGNAHAVCQAEQGQAAMSLESPSPPHHTGTRYVCVGGGGCSSDAGHGELPPHDREKGSNTRGERTGILLLPCRPTAKAPPSPSVVLSLPPPAQTAFRAANPIAQASQACRCVYSATNIPRSPRRPSNTTYFVLNLSGSFDLLHSCNVEVECSG